MKEYVRLSVDITAFYSGNTYYEEVFIPKSVWEEIKSEIKMFIYLHSLDGKHSEVKAEIDVEEFNENQLAVYQAAQLNDGDKLLNHIYEYLDVVTYDNHYLLNVQQQVEALCQVETLSIKIPKNKKEEILELLKDYIIY